MNNYFNKKGPIKPPTQSSDQPTAIAIQNMIHQTALQQQIAAHGRYGDEDYYDEEGDDQRDYMGQEEDTSGRGSPQRMGGGKQLSREEEEMILEELMHSAQDNREFFKVLHILQNDEELRPLIFEHDSLLKTLKDMRELKAEQMLSILTAAETEMYESSKKNEELIQQQRLINSKANVPTETKSVMVDILSDKDSSGMKKENADLKKKVQQLQQENEKIDTLLDAERRKYNQTLEQSQQTIKEENTRNKDLRKQID